MGFDLKAFEKAEFKPRTKKVKVLAEGLKSFFGDKDEKEFIIKALTGPEMAVANEAPEARLKKAQAAAALVSGDATDRIEALRKALGIDGDLTADIIKRIKMLELGLSEPAIDEQLAVKLFNVAPVDCYDITNQIQVLSGQGMMPGELKGSGKKQRSK